MIERGSEGWVCGGVIRDGQSWRALAMTPCYGPSLTPPLHPQVFLAVLARDYRVHVTDPSLALKDFTPFAEMRSGVPFRVTRLQGGEGR